MTYPITTLAIISLVGISVPSAFACTEGQIQHWMGIEFFSTQTISGSSLPDINPFESYELIVKVTPNEITHPNQIVTEKLIADGYIGPFSLGTNGISYSTICVNGVQQMIGGMLLQPDAMTLALAYTITNSIWMAPLAIGLGAGVYLTKNKLKR